MRPMPHTSLTVRASEAPHTTCAGCGSHRRRGEPVTPSPASHMHGGTHAYASRSLAQTDCTAVSGAWAAGGGSSGSAGSSDSAKVVCFLVSSLGSSAEVPVD